MPADLVPRGGLPVSFDIEKIWLVPDFKVRLLHLFSPPYPPWWLPNPPSSEAVFLE